MNLLPFSLSILRGNWKLLLGSGLVLLLIVQTFRLQATEGALSAEKAGRAADRSSYEHAQAEASANALSNKLKIEAQYVQKADAADTRADDLAAKYRALSLRYQAAQSGASNAHLPRPAETAESSSRPGGNPVVPSGSILIPQADALICADGIARLQAAHEWALSLPLP